MSDTDDLWRTIRELKKQIAILESRIEKLEGHYHVEFHGTHGETCTEICTTPPKKGES